MCGKTPGDSMSICACGSVGGLCFLASVVSMFGYIYTAGDKQFEFLGELAIYTVLLSFLFMVITSNIRADLKKNPSNKKSTKVTPVSITTDGFP
tara:strand:- start:16 stop:297 length:282 start_codon:yes stop_codon:yes gene_type:complete